MTQASFSSRYFVVLAIRNALFGKCVFKYARSRNSEAWRWPPSLSCARNCPNCFSARSSRNACLTSLSSRNSSMMAATFAAFGFHFRTFWTLYLRLSTWENSGVSCCDLVSHVAAGLGPTGILQESYGIRLTESTNASVKMSSICWACLAVRLRGLVTESGLARPALESSDAGDGTDSSSAGKRNTILCRFLGVSGLMSAGRCRFSRDWMGERRRSTLVKRAAVCSRHGTRVPALS